MRKILLVVMVLILAAAVLAACSPTAEKPADPSASTKVPVEIQPTASSEAATVATQSPASTATVAQSGAPASTINAEELTNQRCSECHTMARVRNAAKTPEEWTSTVKRMQGKGLSITTEEFDVIVAFLSENYKK